MKIYFYLFLLLICANVYIYLNKSDYTFKKQISYTELYPTVSNLPVKSFSKINDSILQINLVNNLSKEVKWIEKVNDKTLDTFTSLVPKIKLLPGVNSYHLISATTLDSFFLRIEYIAAQKNSSGFTGIYQSNCAAKTLNDIESDKDIFDNISKAQQDELNSIISNSIKIFNNLSTEDKVHKICSFLYKKIYPSVGTPSDSTLALNAFEQYNAAVKGNKIWCGIYARIFNLFAAAANIKCRAVDISSNYLNVQGANHVSNEYFSPEKKQWIAVDIMFNNVAYYNGSGNLLNIVEVKNASYLDSSIKILHATGDSFILKPFSQLPVDFFDLYGREKNLLYTFKTKQQDFNGSKLKRLRNYILPNYWYYIYSDSYIIDNKNFYIKCLLFWALILSAIIIALKYFYNSFNRNK